MSESDQDRIQTHSEECWRWHGHSACAERKVETLLAEDSRKSKEIAVLREGLCSIAKLAIRRGHGDYESMAARALDEANEQTASTERDVIGELPEDEAMAAATIYDSVESGQENTCCGDASHGCAARRQE